MIRAMGRTALLSVLAAVFFATPASAQGADRIWWGGSVGLSFGDVDYIAAEPVIGYAATEKVSFGLGLFYRYRNDDRYVPKLTTRDYGGSVFAQYRVVPFAFLQAEYEHLRYEFVRIDGTTDRDDYNSVLGGVGFVQPIGGHASFYATVLYNFSHDDDELSPYGDPWVYRMGVGVGF